MNRKKFIFLPFVGLAFIALATWLVMLLWNNVVIDILPITKEITFWQSAGLLLLCKILFGSFRGPNRWNKNRHSGPGGLHWRQKWGSMTTEEKEKMKEEWKKRCGK